MSQETTKEQLPKTGIPSKSPAEIAELANDICDGKVFHSSMVEPHEIRSVFMILNFMDQKTVESGYFDNVGLIFEYYQAASPMSCNGKPTFFSCRFLNKEDTEKLKKLVSYISEEKTRTRQFSTYLAEHG